MRFTLRVWRQQGPNTPGKMVQYDAPDVSPDMSFLEMLDVVNERLTESGEEPIAFAHDCREGICGSCSLMINGIAHGPVRGAATCQVHMRSFDDGQTIQIEPWRARAFPVIKDLVVDREALDRIVQAGGFISVPTGSAPDANAIGSSPLSVNRSLTTSSISRNDMSGLTSGASYCTIFPGVFGPC